MVEHISVLLEESIQSLHVIHGGRYIDATLGLGGHSKKILELGGVVLGIDADRHMISLAEERLKPYCPTLVCGNFSDIEKIARTNSFEPVDGILFDLGISNAHYETLGRGFSFRKGSEPLDMRLSVEQGVTAAVLMNSLSEMQLSDMFTLTMQMGEARRYAKRIVFGRTHKPIVTVSDLVEITNPSAELFLAIRMVVNFEIESLMKALTGAWNVLAPNGALAVISFHSGEDRIVKEFMKMHTLNKGSLPKPIVPTTKELQSNAKARSAKLRICIKHTPQTKEETKSSG